MKKAVERQFMDAYDAYAEAIYRHCYFRVFSKERAEELVQDTFMKTWEYMGRGNEIENLRAFLYRVANNAIIDHARKKKEDSLEALMANNPGAEPSYAGHHDLEQQAAIDEIYRGMEALPGETRQLLILRYVDDLDPKDIAEILHISANNVSVKINRAVKQLRENLSE